MSFMAKFLVQGRDAGAVLNRLVTADVDGEAGTITYTKVHSPHCTDDASNDASDDIPHQVLSPFGTLEADLMTPLMTPLMTSLIRCSRPLALSRPT